MNGEEIKSAVKRKKSKLERAFEGEKLRRRKKERKKERLKERKKVRQGKSHSPRLS